MAKRAGRFEDEGNLVKSLAPNNLKDFALEPFVANNIFEFQGQNKTGRDNYVILDAQGKGQYVGCFFYVHNMRRRQISGIGTEKATT